MGNRLNKEISKYYIHVDITMRTFHIQPLNEI